MRLFKQYGRALLSAAAMAVIGAVGAWAQYNCPGDPGTKCGGYGDGDPRIPVIVTQPQGATLTGEERHKLFVEVDVGDTSDLVSQEFIYQWFVCTDEAKTDQKLLSSSSENFYFVYGSPVGLYYFVNVLYITQSSKNFSYGKWWVESKAVKVIGAARANAAIPIIGIESQNEYTVIGKPMGRPLSVSAWVSDNGTLSYQWFSSPNRNDIESWTPIEGATKDTFSPDVSTVGTIYYRVLVTNTNDNCLGEKTASKMSYAAAVRVEGPNTSSAKFPEVSELKPAVPADTVEKSAAFSVTANSPDGGTLSYQWYRTSSESNVGGEPIEGATGATLALNLATAPPTAFYYVEVTNTNDKASGESIAVATSDAKALAQVTAVLIHDRLVPQTQARTETAAVTPITANVSGITAGPNPVDRSRGAVVFFHQGKRLKEVALSVYDASGAFVKKAALRDNAAGGQSRRPIGSWDLTDSKGRSVQNGTYLIKGIIKTADGKSEKVSLVVGVR